MYENNRQVCHNHGGFLPEPRDEGDNQFLDSLDADTFTLGMTDRDVEGQWVWESDGSPVTWFRWVKWNDQSKNARAPNGGLAEQCAVMRRQVESRTRVGPDGWEDYPCASRSYFRSQPTNLICQRKSGMCNQLMIIKQIINFLACFGDRTIDPRSWCKNYTDVITKHSKRSVEYPVIFNAP